MTRGKVSGIYRIRNNVNGKCYVGSSKCIRGRRSAHFSRLERGVHHSAKLQRAWTKYGRTGFVFEVLEEVDDEAELLVREQHWIDSLNSVQSGYNVCEVAGRTTGWRMPPEQRQNLSKLMKQRQMTDSHRERISESLKGHATSPETRQKISHAMRRAYSDPEVRKRCGVSKGNVVSAEARSKMSASQRARWTPEMRRERSAQAAARKHSPEAKAKIAESNRRRVISPETRQKHRAAQLRRAEQRRQEKAGAEGAVAT